MQNALFKPSQFHSGMLLIHLAAANKHSESLKSLYPLYKKPSVQDPASQRKSPIYNAVAQGHLAIVRFLLEKGTDPEEMGEYGVSLMDLARSNERHGDPDLGENLGQAESEDRRL